MSAPGGGGTRGKERRIEQNRRERKRRELKRGGREGRYWNRKIEQRY
jgi:hypothetical protein